MSHEEIREVLLDETREVEVNTGSMGDGPPRIVELDYIEYVEIDEVTLNPSDTENLSGFFRHEAELTDSSGNVGTVTTGDFQIKTDDVL